MEEETSVLVVDDDAGYREHVQRVIRGAIVAREPREGLTIVESQGGIGVIVLDQWYRNTSATGIRAIGAFRRAAPNAAIVIATGDDDSVTVAEAMDAGADYYVDKWDDEGMRAVVRDGQAVAARRRARPARTARGQLH